MCEPVRDKKARQNKYLGAMVHASPSRNGGREAVRLPGFGQAGSRDGFSRACVERR